MAKTRINPNIVDWDEVPTGTIASGANLGLDSGNNVVKASVSGGGGSSSKSFSLAMGGRVKILYDTDTYLVGKASAMNWIGVDWNFNLSPSTYGTGYTANATSFDLSLKFSWRHVILGSVPFAATLENISVIYHTYKAAAAPNEPPLYDIWKATITEGADVDSTVSWSRLAGGGGDNFWTSGNGIQQSHYIDQQTLSSGNSVSAGDVVGITWRSGGDASMSSGHEAHWNGMLVFKET
jgi:hypothetical protein